MKLFNLNKVLSFFIILLLIDCSIGGAIAWWREFYWDAIQKLHFESWLYLIGIFIALALLSCWVSGYKGYLANLISLSMRTKLTRKALKLANHGLIEGGSQRVQEDCKNYPLLLISLIGGSFQALIMIVVFTGLLIYQLPLGYLIIPLIYAVIGTLISAKIAVPLINLNYVNQVVEAKFRQVLSKMNYKHTHRNNFNLFKRSKYLQYFQSFYNQITIIVPHLILSSLLFSGKITFGVFMQVASALVEVINNLSFLINSFGDINLFLSCRKRLKELHIL
jgi:putative ATP-binding cassette transporter